MATRVAVIEGDITQQRVDAIVNAANETLLAGGGVDGAIHDAAGPELFVECATLHGCEPGNAKVTRGHRLAASWVIHTVGPIWRGGAYGEPELLAKCYRRSLEEAMRIGAKSIAFPAISTGAFGYPVRLAAETAATTVLEFVSKHTQPEQVLLVCFDREAHRAYAAAWASVVSAAPPN